MTLTVSLPHCRYPVHIQSGALHQAGMYLAPLNIRRWAVIADETVAALYGGLVTESLASAGLSGELLPFAAGEAHKTPETWLALCRELAQRSFDRGDGVLALGGGVTGDLAGFAAACYQRGLPLVQIPTTLLAQVDSAVGGKTAVDLPEGKNLLGAFYQPRMVLVDPDCLVDLPPRQLRCGVAEVIKYGMIRDAALLALLEEEAPDWGTVIARCLTVKAALVAADERDTGVRRLLNFGHTIGHACEAASGYAMTHGEAVAAGMAAILRWQLRRGDAIQAAYDRLLALLARWRLSAALPCDTQALAEYIRQDKKREGNALHTILLRRVGDAYVEDVSLAALLEGLT